MGEPKEREQADLSWDLSGRLVVGTSGLNSEQERAVARELDPLIAMLSAHQPDVVLSGAPFLSRPEVLELQNPANDGILTARDRSGQLLVRVGARWALVPPLDQRPALIGFQSGLSPSACWGSLVRPVLQQSLHVQEAVAVHAAAVDDGRQGTLLAGWSESGKTEVALALVERGARFLSDKWTVVGADGEASSFPIGVGIRGWVLDALPRLRAALPRGARAQLLTARALGAVTRKTSRLGARSRLGGLVVGAATRAVELGDRAGVAPSALRAAYAEQADPARRVPVGTVVLLVTTPSDDVCVQDLPPAEAARRLARTAAYERRRFFDLQERASYAGLPGRANGRQASLEREEELLSLAFTHDVRLLRVSCPFPGDPRRIADVLAALG